MKTFTPCAVLDLRRPGLGEIYATLVNTALNALRLEGWFPARMSMPLRAKACAFRPTLTIARLYGLRGSVTKLESGWFQSFEHQVDHRYMDPGLAGFGQFLVVFAESSAATQPGQCALYYPTAGQHLEVVAVRTASHHLQQPSPVAQAHAISLPASAASAQMIWSLGNRPSSLDSTSLAPSRSWILAACTTTARSNPVVSTTMWRLRPGTFLPAS